MRPEFETPGECRWSGKAPLCSTGCGVNEIAIAHSKWNGEQPCLFGQRSLCCISNIWARLVRMKTLILVKRLRLRHVLVGLPCLLSSLWFVRWLPSCAGCHILVGTVLVLHLCDGHFEPSHKIRPLKNMAALRIERDTQEAAPAVGPVRCPYWLAMTPQSRDNNADGPKPEILGKPQ
ncbi:hypothetical protein N658DRAFT_489010 [Parathielavia hyrcaniae]|uniref:Uncharacterized protein n=1 Tax=Parathielavia hyrcaniae TaxID=113614 RepID=A0AAN6PTH0_9PEZI|nr:hypothetical protein N658DRAFT_489010 [Parathielavia hyrcaniae]